MTWFMRFLFKEKLKNDIMPNLIKRVITRGYCAYNKKYCSRYHYTLDYLNVDEFIEKGIDDEDGKKLERAIDFLKVNSTKKGTTQVILDFNFSKNYVGNVYISVENYDNRTELQTDFEDVDLQLLEEGDKKFARFLDFWKEIYYFTKPHFGYFTMDDYPAELFPDKEMALNNNKLSTVSPVNFLSKEMVQNIGRDRLLKAPASRVEELRDGGVLIVLIEKSANYSEAKKIKEG